MIVSSAAPTASVFRRQPAAATWEPLNEQLPLFISAPFHFGGDIALDARSRVLYAATPAAIPAQLRSMPLGGPVLNPKFVQWSGFAIAAGGILEAGLNIFLTPNLIPGIPFEQTAASPLFLWRQSLSAAAVLLLLFGSVGLYLAQKTDGALFGAIAFITAFVGSALVLAWEWVDIFVLRELAFIAPAALRALENHQGLSLYDLGALVPVATFVLGWLALACWSWRATPALRAPASLVVIGMFSIPLLTAVVSHRWGGAIGNFILGAGFFLAGVRLQNLVQGTAQARSCP